MKVFISWSGERSKALAEALYSWLPNVIQAVQPWMSANDIEKGTRWRSGLANELEQASISIICLTPENLDAPWLNFEAGALSRQQQNSYVCTFLFGLEPIDVREPLAQFQSTKADKEDIKKLVHTINHVLADAALAETKVNDAFDIWWPRLDEKLIAIEGKHDVGGPPSRSGGTEGQRDFKEILGEILELVRELSREGKNPMTPSERLSFIAGKNLTRRGKRLVADFTGWNMDQIENGNFSPQFINDLLLRSGLQASLGTKRIVEAKLEKDISA